MNIIKSIARKIPKWLIVPMMNLVMACKYRVRIGHGSMVSIDCKFEGHNVVLNHTMVSNSYVGAYSYIASNSNISSARIGRFCSIGEFVRTELGRHPTSFVSSHPVFFSKKTMQDIFGISFVHDELFPTHLYTKNDGCYVVEIGNDVWIGNNVLIMDGIRIGDGAVVAAGSVVTKDVPPYCIVAGVPAKPIRYRFTDEEIRCLLQNKWCNRDMIWIQEHVELFTNIKGFVAAMQREK